MSHRIRSPRYLRGRWPLQGHAEDISGYGHHGTWAGTEAYAVFFKNNLQAALFDGVDSEVSCGDVGVVRSLSFWIRPSTTTEEILLIDTNKSVAIAAGTITYTGVTAEATYVDGDVGITLVANTWQLVVSVLNADVDANTFRLATDGVGFGAVRLHDVRVFNVALTQDEALTLRAEPRPTY